MLEVIMTDYRMLTIVIALVTLTHFGNGVLVVDEDKRQGLIPFPRVGRTLLSSYFRSPYYNPGEIVEPDPFSGASDVFVRYSRSDRAFTPRLGRKKRSLGDDNDGGSSSYRGKLMNLGDLLRRSPWAIITVKGVDKKMAFSPRLGRAMVPRLGRKRSDEEVDKRAPLGGHGQEDDSISVDTRAAAFSPRLGRAGGGRLGRSDSETNENNDQQLQQN